MFPRIIQNNSGSGIVGIPPLVGVFGSATVANGVDIDLSGQPWIVRFHANGGSQLPAVIFGVQTTGNQAPMISPRRLVWIAGDAAAGGNKVILKDIPAKGGTGTPREVAQFIATGADYMPPQEWKAASHEPGFVGLQVTQMDAGVLYIYH